MHAARPMRRLMPLVVLLSLLLAAGSVAHAQLEVDVYWNTTAPSDTVIDFGVTKEGFPVTRTLYVRNRSASTVGLYEAVPNANDPYFVIYNDTARGIPVNAPFKEEFRPVDVLPRFIRPGETGTVRIQFRAVVADPGLPPDTINQCMLDVRVADSADVAKGASGATRFARFVLRARKTTLVLASTTPVITFDSVYVRPSPTAPVRQYSLTNVVDKVIPVEEQRVTMQTPVIDSAEISVATYAQVSFPANGVVSWNVQYRPVNRGEDKASFIVGYKPESTARIDTVLAQIVGIGVEQQLAIVQAAGVPQPVRIAGDTIDFGDVFADGVGSAATIVLRNAGNCSIGTVQEERLGTQRDTAAFRLVQPMSQGGSTLDVGRSDTVVLRFLPTDPGAHVIRYVIRTDLRSRSIFGVPDGAQDITFIVKGRGLLPQIQLSPPSLDFGTVPLYADCNSEVQRTLRIRNVGNTDLRIDSISSVSRAGVGELVTERRVVAIAPGEQQSIAVSFVPGTIGPFAGDLLLHTNGLRAPIDIPVLANVVPPDTIHVRLPEGIRSRPGRVISVPVVVDGSAVSRASKIVLQMTYDPSLLRFRDVVKPGTASEGAR